MLSPDILQQVRTAVLAALDKKAFQLVTLDVTAMTAITDSFIICSGSSDRQVDAIADSMLDRLRKEGKRPLHVEGTGKTGWVLLDFGDFVAHVFSEEKRSYYALDGLWKDAPKVEVSAERGGADEECG